MFESPVLRRMKSTRTERRWKVATTPGDPNGPGASRRGVQALPMIAGGPEPGCQSGECPRPRNSSPAATT